MDEIRCRLVRLARFCDFGNYMNKAIVNRLLKNIERKTADREGKMYLDFLQNRPQATVAAPYSLRPKSYAPVSMPLHWDEVKKGLKIKDHNLRNAIPRLKESGDIFKGVLGKGTNIPAAIKKMNSVFEPV